MSCAGLASSFLLSGFCKIATRSGSHSVFEFILLKVAVVMVVLWRSLLEIPSTTTTATTNFTDAVVSLAMMTKLSDCYSSIRIFVLQRLVETIRCGEIFRLRICHEVFRFIYVRSIFFSFHITSNLRKFKIIKQ